MILVVKPSLGDHGWVGSDVKQIEQVDDLRLRIADVATYRFLEIQSVGPGPCGPVPSRMNARGVCLGIGGFRDRLQPLCVD